VSIERRISKLESRSNPETVDYAAGAERVRERVATMSQNLRAGPGWQEPTPEETAATRARLEEHLPQAINGDVAPSPAPALLS